MHLAKIHIHKQRHPPPPHLCTAASSRFRFRTGFTRNPAAYLQHAKQAALGQESSKPSNILNQAANLAANQAAHQGAHQAARKAAHQEANLAANQAARKAAH